MPETKILTGGKGGGGSSFVSTLLFKWIETPNPDAKLLGPGGRSRGKICHLSNEVMAKGGFAGPVPLPNS